MAATPARLAVVTTAANPQRARSAHATSSAITTSARPFATCACDHAVTCGTGGTRQVSIVGRVITLTDIATLGDIAIPERLRRRSAQHHQPDGDVVTQRGQHGRGVE